MAPFDDPTCHQACLAGMKTTCQEFPFLPQFQPSVNAAHSRVVVQFAIKKPGFFGKAGLLMVELYHHPFTIPSCQGNAHLARNTLEFAPSLGYFDIRHFIPGRVAEWSNAPVLKNKWSISQVARNTVFLVVS